MSMLQLFNHNYVSKYDRDFRTFIFIHKIHKEQFCNFVTLKFPYTPFNVDYSSIKICIKITRLESVNSLNEQMQKMWGTFRLFYDLGGDIFVTTHKQSLGQCNVFLNLSVILFTRGKGGGIF